MLALQVPEAPAMDQSQNIPAELRALPQWVLTDESKVPHDAKTGGPASVTDPSTWGTYEQARSRLNGRFTHVGFVFTEDDDYVGIDLDALGPVEQRIIEAFDSYTERSRSGRGCHVILKGKVPAGVHRDNVEVYDRNRYFIMTGDVVRPVPIAERNDLLAKLVGEMEPRPQIALEDRPSPLTDDELVDMAFHAENGAKFTDLFMGEWQKHGYPSHSEADFALLAMLAFYSPDNEQVRHLFRFSRLYREKATDDYLNRALSKIRANEPPPIDAAALLAQVQLERAPAGPIALSRPPGLVGDLADYIYATAVLPVPEVALAAALGLTAGIAGRQFNISGEPAGLNIYLIVIAPTGVGKEGGKDGISRILSAVRKTVPQVDQFVGPSRFASGQALKRWLDVQPCFLTIQGEFGHTLRNWLNPRASASELAIRQSFLELYSQSGRNKVSGVSAYADPEKNTKLIVSPSMTLLAESTPEVFFECFDASHVAEGLVSRLLVVEYAGDRPSRNRQAGAEPSPALVSAVQLLAHTALSMQQGGTFYQVPQDTEAMALLDAFDSHAKGEINAKKKGTEPALWNRAHLSALKVATLLAVGSNVGNPVVRAEHALWAIDFVKLSVQTVTSRFQRGEVGGGDSSKAAARVQKELADYVAMSGAQRAADDLRVPRAMQQQNRCVPFAYLLERTKRVQPFKDKPYLLRSTLDDMVKSGVLLKLTTADAWTQFKSRGEVYALGADWRP